MTLFAIYSGQIKKGNNYNFQEERVFYTCFVIVYQIDCLYCCLRCTRT